MKTHDFLIANGDTDSISFTKKDHSPFSKQEQDDLLKEINSLMIDGILWAHDKIWDMIAVVGAKNYILKHCSNKDCKSCKGKVKTKLS